MYILWQVNGTLHLQLGFLSDYKKKKKKKKKHNKKKKKNKRIVEHIQLKW